MDERTKEHLTLVLEQEKVACDRGIQKQLFDLGCEFESAGRFHSHSRTVRSVEAMVAGLRGFAEAAIADTRRISPTASGHQLAQDKCRVYCLGWLSRVPEIVWPPKGRRPTNAPPIGEPIDSLLLDMTDEIGRLFKIASFEFGSLAKPPMASAIYSTPRHRPPGLPRLAERDLRKWWERQGNGREQKSLEALYKSAIDVHPGKQVSRERIRALAGQRKRGRKPIG
jgi:hypothetical protein